MVSRINSKSNQYVTDTSGSDILRAIDANRFDDALKIMKGGDLGNRSLSNGQLPLSYAIRHGKIELVQAMLKELNLDPVGKDNQGLTAVDHALITGDPKMVSLVVGHKIGVSFEAALNKSVSLSHKLQMSMIAEEGKQLRSGASFSDKDDVHTAARKGDLTQVKSLMNKKDADPYDKHGMTPLHHAALAGKKDVVAYLLKEGGAKADITTKDGKSLLQLASIGGHADVIIYLVKTQKLDPNAPGGDGRRPLHYAVTNDDLSAAKTLVSLGAHPDQPSEPSAIFGDASGFTPIDLLVALAKERSENRDPLELTRAHYEVFSLIAASCALQVGGLNNMESLVRLFSDLGTLVLGLNSCESEKSKGAIAVAFLVHHFANEAHLKAGKYAYPDGRNLWMGGINKDGETKPRWLLGLDSGVKTALCYQVAKGAMKGLVGAWKSRSLESFRPLRNAVVHSVIGAMTLKSTAEAVSSNFEYSRMYNFWDNDFMSATFKEGTDASGVTHTRTNRDVFRSEDLQAMSALFNAFPGAWQTENSDNAPPPSSAQIDRSYIHSMCQGKNELDCLLEGAKDPALPSIDCPSDTAQDCKFSQNEKDQTTPITRREVQARSAAVLGLKENYTDKDCKKAYRTLNLRYHPDKKPEGLTSSQDITKVGLVMNAAHVFLGNCKSA